MRGVAFQDPKSDERDKKKAIAALGRMKDLRAIAVLLGALAQSNLRSVRVEAATALGRKQNVSAVVPLINCLADGYKDVRMAAASALAELGEPHWGHLVKGDDDDFSRLAKSADARAVEPLLNALRVRPLFDAEHAIWALAQRRESRAVPLFIGALDSEEAPTHRAASIALVTLKARDALINALATGESRTIRCGAAKALGMLKDPLAVEPLIGALEQEDSSVRECAAGALGRLKDPLAVEPLLRALERRKDEGIPRALGRLKDLRAVDPLIKILGTGHWRDIRNAAIALGELGDERAVAALLVQTTESGFRGCRLAAIQALDELSGG